VTAPQVFNPPTVIATDNQSWNITKKAEVLGYDVVTTIDMHCNTKLSDNVKQVIVICSWMPMNEDWTKYFRVGNVDEYILIGESDDGNCGDNWATWGNPKFHPCYDVEKDIIILDANNESNNKNDNNNPGNSADCMIKRYRNKFIPTPPYELDGYIRTNLDYLSKYQFSRFDSRVSKTGRTVSFRRGTSL
jgi:hypothetical protein